MNELKVMKTAVSVSKMLNLMSTIATVTALISAACVMVSFLRKVKA
ncbi:MAG: hypothetical protein IJZ57_05690 [Clostridia bacterium]|nr:hypothetical protein [Clostridia bacterium]